MDEKKIHSIIDEAMATRDRSVSIYILLDPEYLITTTHETHQAIHYGDKNLLLTTPLQRTRNDTCPWKH